MFAHLWCWYFLPTLTKYFAVENSCLFGCRLNPIHNRYCEISHCMRMQKIQYKNQYKNKNVLFYTIWVPIINSTSCRAFFQAVLFHNKESIVNWKTCHKERTDVFSFSILIMIFIIKLQENIYISVQFFSQFKYM